MWPFKKKEEKKEEPKVEVGLEPLPVSFNPTGNMRADRRRGRLFRLEQAYRNGDRRPALIAEIEMLKKMGK